MKPPVTIEIPVNFLSDKDCKLRPIAGGLRFVSIDTGEEYELYRVNRDNNGKMTSFTLVPLGLEDAREEGGTIQ